MEFREDLAAGSARADRDIRFRNNGHAAKVPVSRRHGSTDGHSLGAHRQPEAEILDIAARENRAVAAFDGRTNGEIGIRRMGVAPCLDGGLHKGFAVHAGKIIRARSGVYFFPTRRCDVKRVGLGAGRGKFDSFESVGGAGDVRGGVLC